VKPCHLRISEIKRDKNFLMGQLRVGPKKEEMRLALRKKLLDVPENERIYLTSEDMLIMNNEGRLIRIVKQKRKVKKVVEFWEFYPCLD